MGALYRPLYIVRVYHENVSRTIELDRYGHGLVPSPYLPGNKVILAEASTVAVDNIDGHVLGFGTEALIHYHKAPENISLEWPVQNGVIADYDMTKSMLRFFIRKSLHHAVSRPTVMISIPGETSSVTRHALVDALIHAGAQHVYLLPSPAAAAIGAGKDMLAPSVIFSLVIGRDVADAGLYSCGGIVTQEGIPFGGIISIRGSASICRKVSDHDRAGSGGEAEE